MGGGNLRTVTVALLASTALASPAISQTGVNDTAPSPAAQVSQDGLSPDLQEIIVTAQKREENLSRVPISIQAIGTRRLDQLNISNFEQYTKQLPSVSFQTTQPGLTVVYMRGVASGGDGNHSGSLPSVGTYLDEQPVTTIGGTLDVHIYDIARIESLAGPQGTLYGASSEAGTIRIITNKPKLRVAEGRVDGDINSVAHGGVGGKIEGMINLPIAERIAFRGVAFAQRDAGYINNILGSRTYYIYSDIPDLTVNNANLVKKNFNRQDVYGGRAALKIDLDDSWTITPTVLYQHLEADGSFAYDPELGELKIDRLFPEVRTDKFVQAALTVEGKLGNFDVTYAGAYLDRRTYTATDYSDYADAYDQLYASYAGGGLGYFYYQDSSGNYIDPRQRIVATDHFRKMSHEFRIASPSDQPFRVIAGAFYQRQSNLIHQDYKVDGLDPNLSVNGSPGSLWLTQQKRIDRDYALFGEASLDILPKVTVTGGGRLFKFDNTLIGFFGFGRNPGNGFSDSPPNAAGSNRTGVAQCFTASGERLYDRSTDTYSSSLTLVPPAVGGSPCTNLGEFRNGSVVLKRAKDRGFTHRLNLQYKPTNDLMLYATWSRGFRPGGINRRSTVRNYAADFLNNYELGWKVSTAGGAIRWNGAVFHQRWKGFQYSFLGLNSFTEIHNGQNADVNGLETDVSYVGGGFNFNIAGAYTDAKTKGQLCFFDSPDPTCSVPSSDDYANFVSVPSGTRLPITPKLKLTATARYSWPVFTDAKAHLQLGAAYQSSASATLRKQILLVPYGLGVRVNPNDFLGRIRSAALFDIAAGVDWRSFSMEAYAHNLFDKRNDLSRYVACASCTRTLVVPGTPRTIGVRAGLKF